MADTTPHCVGEDYRDFCTDPECLACTLWQRPDETYETWAARIWRHFNAGSWRHRERRTGGE